MFKLFPLARDFLEKSGNYDTVIVHKKIRSQYESDALFTEVVIYTQGKYDFLTLCATWEGGLVDTRLFPPKTLRTTCAMLIKFCPSEQNLVIIFQIKILPHVNFEYGQAVHFKNG